MDFRSKVIVNSVATFLLSVVVILILNSRNRPIEIEMLSSIFWIVVLFLATITISDTFLKESDGNTSHILLTNSGTNDLFLGKALYSFLSLILPSSLFLCLCLYVFKLYPANTPLLLTGLLLGIAGVSLLSTFMGAVLASLSKGRSLFPVLTIPILVPLLVSVTDLTTNAFVNSTNDDTLKNIIVLVSFIGVFSTLSYLTFGFIKEEL